MTEPPETSSSTRHAQRRLIISDTLREVRKLIQNGIDRNTLDDIRKEMEILTHHSNLFDSRDFPLPSDHKPSRIYLLSEDRNQSLALYLVTGDKRVQSPAHNHNTWAVIAGMAGEEENTLYSKIDAPSSAKQAMLRTDNVRVIRKGDSIAFLSDDIHSIRVISDEPSCHFHLYGVSFARQAGRLGFDLESGRIFEMPSNGIHVDTSRQIDDMTISQERLQ